MDHSTSCSQPVIYHLAETPVSALIITWLTVCRDTHFSVRLEVIALQRTGVVAGINFQKGGGLQCQRSVYSGGCQLYIKQFTNFKFTLQCVIMCYILKCVWLCCCWMYFVCVSAGRCWGSWRKGREGGTRTQWENRIAGTSNCYILLCNYHC